MKVIKNHFNLQIESDTVTPEEVYVVMMEKDEILNIRLKNSISMYKASGKCFLIVDNFVLFDNNARVTGIRQILESDEVTQNYGDYNAFIRKICKDRGAIKVCVPGGCPPLTKPNEIAIPNFKVFGTEWFLMPIKIYNELIGTDKEVSNK